MRRQRRGLHTGASGPQAPPDERFTHEGHNLHADTVARPALPLPGLFGVALAKEAAAITPNQARKAGIPPEMVAAMSARKPGTPELTSISTTDAQRVFGKQGA